MIYCNFM